MNWIWVIIIGYFLYQIYKWRESRLPGVIIARNEELAETFLSGLKTINKASYGQEEDDDSFVLIKSFYVRLKEKYKHEDKKLVEISRDWKDYAFCLSQHSTGVYLWLEEEDKEASSERDKEIRENLLRIEEIENRFAEMLGDKYREELDNFREKKKQESIFYEDENAK